MTWARKETEIFPIDNNINSIKKQTKTTSKQNTAQRERNRKKSPLKTIVNTKNKPYNYTYRTRGRRYKNTSSTKISTTHITITTTSRKKVPINGRQY